MHQLPDHRTKDANPRGASAGRRRLAIRLRRLPGRLPVEPPAGTRRLAAARGFVGARAGRVARTDTRGTAAKVQRDGPEAGELAGVVAERRDRAGEPRRRPGATGAAEGDGVG